MANTADDETLAGRWFRYGKLWAPVLGLMAVAGALRFLGLGVIPPGLYHDEAFNGLDALGILEGHFPLYFEANHGREPLFLYLVAATVGVLGRTPAAVRLAAAVCGTVTVPATYLMARSWFDRRTALLSAFIISTTLWHLHLSRVGFRAVMLPLAIAGFLWAGGRALRLGHARAWLLTGMLYGATFYTYLAARFTPIALVGFTAYLVLTDQADLLRPGAIYFGLGALVALIPLGAYSVLHWQVVMGRPGQVSLLNPRVHQGDFWGALGRHLLRTLEMFFIRGDTIPRHNVPGRPVFAPLMGAAMLLGVGRAAILARRRDTGAALTLIWVGTMLVPTLAAADAPHFLRAVGVLPSLVVLPALGLDAVLQASARRGFRLWGSVLVCLVLTISLSTTVQDYFLDYATDPEVAYAFESAATELAAQINRFIGSGWNGSGVSASSRPVVGEPRVYLDLRLWQAWRGLSFLVPEQEALVTLEPSLVPSMAAADRLMLLLWPYDDLQPYLKALPHPARIKPSVGPLTKGDLEERSYPAYASYVVEPLTAQSSAPIARFGESVELSHYTIDTQEGAWQVRLEWRARAQPEEDYVAFVYLCSDRCKTGQLLAQNDAPPGGRYYPTRLWRPGDVVVDVRTLQPTESSPVRPEVAVGLYTWPALDRLPVTVPSGSSSTDVFVLP